MLLPGWTGPVLFFCSVWLGGAGAISGALPARLPSWPSAGGTCLSLGRACGFFWLPPLVQCGTHQAEAEHWALLEAQPLGWRPVLVSLLLSAPPAPLPPGQECCVGDGEASTYPGPQLEGRVMDLCSFFPLFILKSYSCSHSFPVFDAVHTAHGLSQKV